MANQSLIDFFTANDCDAVRAAARAASSLPSLETGELLAGSTQTPVEGGLHCPRLFVDEGWARIELSFPILHPRCMEAIARALGWEPLQVWLVASEQAWIEGRSVQLPPGHPGMDLGIDLYSWAGMRPLHPSELDDALARWRALGLEIDALLSDDGAWEDAAMSNTGVAALEALVGTEWSIEDVPVPPPTWRPLLVRPSGVLVPSPRTRALRRLLEQALRGQRLVELGAPPTILRNERKRLQLELRDALEAWCGGERLGQVLTPVPAAASVLPERDRVEVALFGDDGTEPIGLVVLGDTIAVDWPELTQLLDEGGRVLSSWPSHGAVLIGAVDESTLQYHCPSTGASMYRDLTRSAWLDRHPEAARLLVTEHQEQALLVDLHQRRSHRLPEVIGHVTQIRRATGGELVAVRGEEGGWAVYGAGGELFCTLDPWQLVPHEQQVLNSDGTTVDDEFHEWEGSSAFAFGVWADALRWIAEGSLFVGLRHAYALAFPVHAAAFAPDGQRAVLATSEGLVWVQTERPEIVARLPLVRPGVVGGPPT